MIIFFSVAKMLAGSPERELGDAGIITHYSPNNFDTLQSLLCLVMQARKALYYYRISIYSTKTKGCQQFT